MSRQGSSWTGTDAGDIDAYLRAFAAGGYEVQQFAHPICACGHSVGFTVWVDDDEGVALRCCAACGDSHVMLDGADYLDDAQLGQATCPCGHQQFDVAVGYALREDAEVRWVSVALRCRRDGQLGVYADWKIDYSPSRQLLASA